jgi:hypothetical protein
VKTASRVLRAVSAGEHWPKGAPGTVYAPRSKSGVLSLLAGDGWSLPDIFLDFIDIAEEILNKDVGQILAVFISCIPVPYFEKKSPAHYSMDWLKGTFTRTLYFMGKTMVSCRFSLKPIH